MHMCICVHDMYTDTHRGQKTAAGFSGAAITGDCNLGYSFPRCWEPNQCAPEEQKMLSPLPPSAPSLLQIWTSSSSRVP